MTTIRIPRELHEWLRQHAFDTGRSQNSIVTQALSELRSRSAREGAGHGAVGH